MENEDIIRLDPEQNGRRSEKGKMRDEEIVRLYWERSQSAIAETSAKYGGYCGRIAANILENSSDAEECLNDVWLAAWNAIPPNKPSPLSAFLGKITRNIAVNRLKSNGAAKRGGNRADVALSELEECLPSKSSVEREAESALITESINKFLKKLPKRRRDIFVLRYWYLLSVGEIAEKYSMSESAAASVLFRLRQKLKAQLEKDGIEL